MSSLCEYEYMWCVGVSIYVITCVYEYMCYLCRLYVLACGLWVSENMHVMLMCLHIIMQLYYDCDSHPSANLMLYTASCRLAALEA